MKPPRFTDSDRYPHGYTPAVATDIRRTFARASCRQLSPQEIERRQEWDEWVEAAQEAEHGPAMVG